MKPITIIARLALACLFNVAAIVVGLLQLYAWHDTTAALASFGGLALCAWIVSPNWSYVEALSVELKALADQG